MSKHMTSLLKPCDISVFTASSLLGLVPWVWRESALKGWHSHPTKQAPTPYWVGACLVAVQESQPQHKSNLVSGFNPDRAHVMESHCLGSCNLFNYISVG